jgi:hemolysin D
MSHSAAARRSRSRLNAFGRTRLSFALSKTLARAAEDVLREYEPASASLLNARVSPVAARIGVVVPAIVVACMVVICVLPLNRVVPAKGRIVATSPTTVVGPLETSIVRSVDVKVNQQVRKGQVLATLDPTFAGSDDAQYAAQVQSFSAEVAREQDELANRIYDPKILTKDTLQQKQMFDQRKEAEDAQMSEYQQKIASLEHQTQSADSDVGAYTSRLTIATDVEGMRKELESQKIGSRLDSLQAADNRMDLTRLLAEAKATAAAARANMAAEIQERDYTLQNSNAETSQALVEAERNLGDAREYLAKAALRKNLVEMRAASDGRVQWIAKVAPGTVMQPGEQLMSIVPDGTRLEVEARVPGDEIGFAHVGQTVSISLDSLPSHLYGDANGKVMSISPDSFTSSDTGTTTEAQRSVSGLPSTLAGSASPTLDPNQNSVEPGYYLARIDITEEHFHNLPPDFHMTPGMSLSADIKVGRRTLLAYLIGRVAPTMSVAY